MARESLALGHARAEAGSRQMFEDVAALLHTCCTHKTMLHTQESLLIVVMVSAVVVLCGFCGCLVSIVLCPM